MSDAQDGLWVLRLIADTGIKGWVTAEEAEAIMALVDDHGRALREATDALAGLRNAYGCFCMCAGGPLQSGHWASCLAAQTALASSSVADTGQTETDR